MVAERGELPIERDLPNPNELGLRGIGFLLGVAHRAHRRIWEKELEELHVTAPQAAILRLIAEVPGSGIRELARRLGTDPMNAQRIVKSLVTAGLCEVCADAKDARRHPLYPTVQGISLAAHIGRRADGAEESLRESLGSVRYLEMVTSLEMVIGADERSKAIRPK